jgi:ribosomal protein S18 acetylase RimI-like enzyme
MVHSSWIRPAFGELQALEQMVFPDLPAKEGRLKRLLADQDIIFLSAYDKNLLVGYAVARKVEERHFRPEQFSLIPAALLPRTAHLDSIGVHPRYHGQGIGQAMALVRKHYLLAKGYTHATGHYRRAASEHIVRKYVDVMAELPAPDHTTRGETFQFIFGRII